MLNHSMRKTLLLCALGISGCVGSGNVRQIPVCPKLPPAPASLMQTPSLKSSLQQKLYDSAPSTTPGSKPSKTS